MTGADLSTIPGRRKNDDTLDVGIWIKHPDTSVVHLVNHKAHVKRLLDMGGVQVSGPESDVSVAVEAQAATIADLQAQLAALQARLAQEEAHGSQSHDVTTDSPRPPADRRPVGSKSAVR